LGGRGGKVLLELRLLHAIGIAACPTSECHLATGIPNYTLRVPA
jgi:hypothetical protein